MKKGILITCLSVLLLSGCGSSGKGTKAIKECKQTDNYTCVTKEVNDMLPSSAEHDGVSMFAGSQIKTGKQVIFKNNGTSNGTYDLSMYIYDKDNWLSTVNFMEEDDVKINKNSEYVYDLPEEAVGKYFLINVAEHSGSPELTIEVV